MVFTDLPLIDRVRRIDELGFAVEIWSWHDKDLDALAATGARFSSMTGYLHGDLIDPASADEVVRTAELSIKAAETLGVPRLNLHTAELVDGKAARPRHRATGEMWLTAQRALERIGELGAAAGVTFCVENLNTIVDHPGVPLARAKDTLALVEAVGHPNVRMMLDLYHAQIGEGNLIELIRRCGDAIGEVQVADVPGRCEPGTGEINYPAIAKALRDIGFTGTVGMEAWASGDSDSERARRLPARVHLAPLLPRNGIPAAKCRVDACWNSVSRGMLGAPAARDHGIPGATQDGGGPILFDDALDDEAETLDLGDHPHVLDILRTIRAVLVTVVLGDDLEVFPSHVNGAQQRAVNVEYRYLSRGLGHPPVDVDQPQPRLSRRGRPTVD